MFKILRPHKPVKSCSLKEKRLIIDIIISEKQFIGIKCLKRMKYLNEQLRQMSLISDPRELEVKDEDEHDEKSKFLAY